MNHTLHLLSYLESLIPVIAAYFLVHFLKFTITARQFL